MCRGWTEKSNVENAHYPINFEINTYERMTKDKNLANPERVRG
jgi:hypothetical protein